MVDQAGGSIAHRFHARDAHLVLSPGAQDPTPFRVLLDGERPGQSHGQDVDEDGTACSDTAACISSSANTTPSVSERWRSRSSGAGPRPTRSPSGRQELGDVPDQPSPSEAMPPMAVRTDAARRVHRAPASSPDAPDPLLCQETSAALRRDVPPLRGKQGRGACFPCASTSRLGRRSRSRCGRRASARPSLSWPGSYIGRAWAR